jgi:hypothetical protein
MNDYKIHRSLPSLDLISMAINAKDERSSKWGTTNAELFLLNKRISSNNGWDHYGSCKDKYRKNKYQLWREGKQIRSRFIAPDRKQLSKVSLHTTFSSITELSNESTSTSTTFETGNKILHPTTRTPKGIPHAVSVFVNSPERRDRHSARKARFPHRFSTM